MKPRCPGDISLFKWFRDLNFILQKKLNRRRKKTTIWVFSDQGSPYLFSHHRLCFVWRQTWVRARSGREARWCRTFAAGTFSQTLPPWILDLDVFWDIIEVRHLGRVHKKHLKLSQMHLSLLRRKLKQFCLKIESSVKLTLGIVERTMPAALLRVFAIAVTWWISSLL